MSVPAPQIIVGNSQEQPVDSLYAAYQKYNQHTHATIQPPTFLAFKIKLGDTVVLRSVDNLDAFGSDSGLTTATVVGITDTYIEVNRSAQQTVSVGTATIAGSKFIPYLTVTQLENRIYFASTDAGFFDPLSLYFLLHRSLTATHTFPYEPAASETEEPLFTIPLLLAAPQTYRLSRFILKLVWQENSTDVLLTCRLKKTTPTEVIYYSDRQDINTLAAAEFDLTNTLIPIYPNEALDLDIFAYTNLGFLACQTDLLTLL